MQSPFNDNPLFVHSFSIGNDQMIHIGVFQKIVNQYAEGKPDLDYFGDKDLARQQLSCAVRAFCIDTSLENGVKEPLWKPKSLVNRGVSNSGLNLGDLVSGTSKWLFIQLPYHKVTLDVIRRIPNRSYNVIERYWIAPLTQESIEVLKLLGWDEKVYEQLELLIASNTNGSNPYIGTIEDKACHDAVSDIITAQSVSAPMPERLHVKAGDLNSQQLSTLGLEVTILRHHIHVRLPYSKDGVALLKTIKGAYWCNHQRIWKIPKSRESLDRFQFFSNYWSKDEFEQLINQLNQASKNERVELYFTPEHSGSIVLKLSGRGADVSFIKSLPQRRYDQERQRWFIPNDQVLIKRVLDHYTTRNAEIINKLTLGKEQESATQYIKANTIQYLLKKYGSGALNQMEAFIHVLVQKRYSQHTVRMYVSALSSCWKYLNFSDIGEATTADLNRYLSNLAIEGVSDARMHMAVNAIKFYYTHVDQRTDIRVQLIHRPKGASQLPEVLSIKEVDMLLRSLNNIKHVTILYLLYSTGMRLSEILSLRIYDLQWDRDQIYIRSAKGKKDRYVMLAEPVKALLSQYFETYKPRLYLFEGQDESTQYSGRSVQAIVKKAARRAGIQKHVTPHLLRHCFATHLVDGGTHIKYVQELLGHKNTNPDYVIDFRSEGLNGKKISDFAIEP